MKRSIPILLSLVIAIIFLTACAADSTSYMDAYPEEASIHSGFNTSSSSVMFDEAAEDYDMYVAEAPEFAGEVMMLADDSIMASEADYEMEDSGSGGVSSIPAPVAGDLAEKIIYTYYAHIETLGFDETLANLTALITAHGAFVESSNISGNTLQRSGVSYRYADFTIRVPVNQLNAVTARLDTLGNIVSQNSNASNITSQFIDTESRLNSLRVQEERLLDMFDRAQRISDLMEIEEQLAYVRYQIESLTSTLNNWQRQVDYSTLTLSIQEVEEYIEVIDPDITYWEEMGAGLLKTLRAVGNFFASLFMWLVTSAPVLIILAAIVIVVVILVRRSIRKKSARAEQKLKDMPNANPPVIQAYQPYTQDMYPPPQAPQQDIPQEQESQQQD